MPQYFEFLKEVADALRDNQPILALESTLITHGLPYPYNLEVALAVEAICKNHGVVPATLAVINGKVKVGLTQSELELLATDSHLIKASRHDLPWVITQRRHAGLTVAATLFCAHQAGIKVFATGGIGGVHRGHDMDISADLIALSQIPMAVVCAGAKAILDLPKTLEFLETYGVPVIGYQTTTLPAFYTRETDYVLTQSVNTLDELASLFNVHHALKLASSMLIVNPIPKQDEISKNDIEPAIEAALRLAVEKQICGKAVTPFLLAELATVTAGRSMHANMSLIKHNVHVGAQLAKNLVS